MATNYKNGKKRGFAVVEIKIYAQEVIAILVLRDIQGMSNSLKNKAKSFRNKSLQHPKN
ncbi:MULTISPECIES: hypothetical protein [unclassified Nostoc]|uniref:hypothetical protein n=1 Tax=unclassified Nostoc TaxID=2593658 RepID=UPI002AD3E1E6|nr:hypothetical protein [Nostoc sp. DedQUE03]MDZ7974563.1 hypothetical protein [Nostoc sp. DedQUE03]